MVLERANQEFGGISLQTRKQDAIDSDYATIMTGRNTARPFSVLREGTCRSSSLRSLDKRSLSERSVRCGEN